MPIRRKYIVKEGTELGEKFTPSLGIHATAKEIASLQISAFGCWFIFCGSRLFTRFEECHNHAGFQPLSLKWRECDNHAGFGRSLKA